MRSQHDHVRDAFRKMTKLEDLQFPAFASALAGRIETDPRSGVRGGFWPNSCGLRTKPSWHRALGESGAVRCGAVTRSGTVPPKPCFGRDCCRWIISLASQTRNIFAELDKHNTA